MKKLRLLILSVTFLSANAMATDELNYDNLIHLDAEDLAEGGIDAAYQRLLPDLRKYVKAPATVHEELDHDAPSYRVKCAGKEYLIYAPGDEDQSWVRAAVALFDIVNRQLENTGYRFYALYGGNDLGGMFLTPAAVAAARKSLAKKERPYFPTLDGPWNGMEH
jgi:hypothetical protein